MHSWESHWQRLTRGRRMPSSRACGLLATALDACNAHKCSAAACCRSALLPVPHLSPMSCLLSPTPAVSRHLVSPVQCQPEAISCLSCNLSALTHESWDLLACMLTWASVLPLASSMKCLFQIPIAFYTWEAGTCWPAGPFGPDAAPGGDEEDAAHAEQQGERAPLPPQEAGAHRGGW